jgi:hypothetical protein
VIGTPARLRTGSLLRVLLAGLVLAATAGCTGGPGDAPSGTPGQGSSATTSPGPPSVPVHAEVTHVAGKLSAAGRRTLAAKVGRVVSAYSEAAFLSGRYPRSDFAGSFGSFTAGAARTARHDRAQLTNQPLGPGTRAVHATRRTAYLSVLAPGQKVAGVTAAVDLVFVIERDDATSQRVRLKGRLLLTHGKSGAWRIFGYDLHRSQTPVGGAS